jgi:uncharacterized membrane protein HdeD (DUF308 family)
MDTIIDKINFEVKNWWVSLLLGLFYIGISLLLIFTPMASYVALSILFACFMFVTGTLEILFSVSNKGNLSSWGWYLACGILDLIIGIYLMSNVSLSMDVLPFVIAFWLMFRGFSATAYSLDLKRYGSHSWGWYMVFGLLSVICSIAIIWQPGIGAFATVYLIAYTLLFLGIFRVILSFELKSIHKRFKHKKHEDE